MGIKIWQLVPKTPLQNIGTFKFGCLVRDCCTYIYTTSMQFGGFLMVANIDHQTTKFNFLGHQNFRLYGIMHTIHLHKYNISCSCPTNEEVEKEKQSREDGRWKEMEMEERQRREDQEHQLQMMQMLGQMLQSRPYSSQYAFDYDP